MAKKTGVITNDTLDGATPACFSSHADNRGDSQQIINGQITSDIDILLGQAKNSYATFQNEFESAGYTYVDSTNDLFSLTADKKILANIPNIRSIYNQTLSNQSDFSSIVDFTLHHLDNEKGFCLMIENAYIDKCSHNNDINGAMCEVRSFAESIQAVFDFCKNRNDTAIVITADHETGGLVKASQKSQLTNDLYTTTNHTAANVPLYLYGSRLKGVKDSIDNTQIFDIGRKIMR